MKSTALFLLLGAVLQAGTLSTDLTSLAQPPQGGFFFSGFMSDGAASPTIDVVVQFNGVPDAAMLNQAIALGGSITSTYDQSAIVSFKLTTASILALRNNPNVKYATPSRTLSGSLDYANPAVNGPLTLARGMSGAGIGVAIIDSGIDTSHPDLASRVVYPGENKVRKSPREWD